jgi:hypothetical protein
MLSLKALRNQERLKRMLSDDMKNKPVKIVPCSESSQVYSWQRTNKKSQIRPKKEFERQLKSFNIRTRK